MLEALPKFVRKGRAAVLGKQACPHYRAAVEDCAGTVAAAYELEEAANRLFLFLIVLLLIKQS